MKPLLSPWVSRRLAPHGKQTPNQQPLGFYRRLARGFAYALLICLGLGFSPLSQAGQGWPWLNQLLDKITPSVDTSIPLSEDQIARQIASLLKHQEYHQALNVAQAAYEKSQKRNIQFLYLIGEARRGLGQWKAAQQIFKDLTQKYPEIPQPWNSLALVQIHFHQWDDALQSLQMALLADPNNKAAARNLAYVQAQLPKAPEPAPYTP